MTSRNRAGAIPCVIPKVIASAIAAIWTPASSWFTAFIAEPAPASSPSSKTVSAMAASTGRAAAKASGVPEAITDSRPSRRPDRAARDRRVEVEDAARGAAGRHARAKSGATVAQATTTAPGRSAAPPRRAEEHRLGLRGVQHRTTTTASSLPATSASAPGRRPRRGRRSACAGATSKP